MKILKRTAAFAAALVLLCLLTGCVRLNVDIPADMPLTVYASFRPVYMLASAITEGGPGISVYCLTQPQNGCPLSYTLSDWDAALLEGADIFVYCGIEDESVASGAGEDCASVDLCAGMELIETGGTEETHFAGENRWCFLSPVYAERMLAVMAGAMEQLDPDHADMYRANLEKAAAELDALIGDMGDIYACGVPERAALMQEGLVYIACDAGISETLLIEREAGSDMGDNELAEALDKMRAAGCDTALIEKQAPDALIRALGEAGIKVIKLDILIDGTGGFDVYISKMLENARSLAG